MVFVFSLLIFSFVSILLYVDRIIYLCFGFVFVEFCIIVDVLYYVFFCLREQNCVYVCVFFFCQKEKTKNYDNDEIMFIFLIDENESMNHYGSFVYREMRIIFEIYLKWKYFLYFRLNFIEKTNDWITGFISWKSVGELMGFKMKFVVFSISRVAELTLSFILYAPIGLCLVLIRSIILLCLFMISSVLPASSSLDQ